MDNINLEKEFFDKYKQILKDMTTINIMLIGKTGVGKSTLINSLFRENLASTGIGKPVTKHVVKITKEGIPLCIYDTKGLELNKETQVEAKEEIIKIINEGFTEDEKNKIHIVYYCINGLSGRIENEEIELINTIGEHLPVIVVVTQSIGENSAGLKKYIDTLDLKTVASINVLSKEYKLNDNIKIEPYGLKELLDITLNNMDKELKKSFINAQQVDVDRKVKEARRWAKGYIGTTFGIGFTPIPFADASLLVPTQIGMLAHITSIFGVSMDKEKLVSILAAIGGTGGATFLGRTIVANVLKLIPGVGTVTGGLISGATASLLTTALAMSYIEVLTFIAKAEKNGKEIDFSLVEKLMKEAFKKYLKGKGGKDSENRDN